MTIRLVAILLLCTSVYVLIMSGTRSAFVFYIAASLTFLILRYGPKVMLFLIAGVVCGTVFVYLIDGVETLRDFLRLEGNLNQISSKDGLVLLACGSFFVASPFAGLGFGSADQNFPVKPSNIFYLAILAEIGLFGFLGALMILNAFNVIYSSSSHVC